MNNRVLRILPTTVLIGSLGLSFWGDNGLWAQTSQTSSVPTTKQTTSSPSQSNSSSSKSSAATARPTNTTPTMAPGNATSVVTPGNGDLSAVEPPPPPPPLPSNPLLIVDPKGGTGNTALYYDRNGNILPGPNSSQMPTDYRPDPLAPPMDSMAKPLPLFGYNYFEPSRQLIDTRRRYLQERYQTGNTLPFGMDTQSTNTLGTTQPNGASDVGLGGPNSSADTALGTNAPAGLTGASRNTGMLPTSTGNGYNNSALSNSANPNLSTPYGQQSQGQSNFPTGNNGMANGTNAYGSNAFGTYGSPYGAYGSPYSNGMANGTNAYGSNAFGTYGSPYGAYGSPYSNGMANGTNAYGSNAYGAYGSPYGNYASPYGSSQAVPTGLDSVSAYQQVVDPLTQQYSNVAATLPPSYQISGGDTLSVEFSTPTQDTRTFDAKVDAQGSVTLGGAGRVIVRGLTVTQAQTAIQSRMRRFYQGAQITITLRGLRTIPVTVSGAAYVPGTYVVPAVTTVYNILYAAGGPTEEGTLRSIEVRRQGKLLHRFDFYQFLLGGDTTGGITLEPGDSIYIPPRLNHITVRGEVRLPAVYELTEADTLRDALRYAGGVKASGVGQHIQINTVDPGSARVLRDINLTDAASVGKASLYDGDIVDVFSIRATLTNRVTVQGAVDQPGDYALTQGMHVSDLIERARGPMYNAYTSRADLYRDNSDNTQTLIQIDLDRAMAHDPAADVALTRWDTLKVYTRQEVAWTGNQQVTVRGPVQRPGTYPLSKNMHLSDLLLMAGGTTPDAYLNRASVLHQNGDGTFVYQDVNLGYAIQGDAAQDPILQDNDVLAIYTASQAHFEPDHVVTILGEVVTPGVYPRGEGMRLSDLLRRSGGFRPGAMTHVKVAHAYRVTEPFKTNLKTAAIDFDAQGQTAADQDAILQDGDVVTVQGTGDFRDFVSVVTVSGAVNHPGPIALTSKMHLSDIIREAGGLRPEAFPEGVEFTRDPKLMANAGQHELAVVINKLNDLLNASAYKRALAVSDLDRAKAANQVSTDSASPLAGLSATTAVTSAAAGAAFTNNLSQHDLVTPARELGDNELNPHGNIAVNLAEALHKPGGDEDIQVLNGDTLVIPERPTTVQVVGAVFNGRGVLFKPGAPISYYVDLAGGYAPDAARDRIEVIHAGGGLIPASKVRELRPGDIVLVPTRVLAEKISKNSNAFDDFFKGLTNTAVVFAVLKSVLRL